MYLIICFKLVSNFRFSFVTADYCTEKFGSVEFLKSEGIVYCLLNIEPCLWRTKQVCTYVSCHQSYSVSL